MTGALRIPIVFAATIASIFGFHEIADLFRNETRDYFDFAEQYRFMYLYPLNGFVTYLSGAIPFVLIEMTAGKNRSGISLRQRYLVPMLIWAGYYTLSLLVVVITGKIRQILPIQPFITLANMTSTPYLLIYILLIDFFAYWFHRAEHAVPFLWKFHSTHHALTNINAINQYGHWFEGMFRFFAIYVPIAFILPTPDLSASSITLIWSVWTLYVHTDAGDLKLPKQARYVMVDNLYHHFHHGRQKEYHDKNFGFLLSIWDHIFGTAYLPKNDIFPETGLDDLKPPSGLIEYIWHPFKQPR